MASDPLLVSDVSIAAWVGSPSRDRPTGGGENADVVRVKEDAPTFNRNLCESHCSGYQKDSKGNGSTHPRAVNHVKVSATLLVHILELLTGTLEPTH